MDVLTPLRTPDAPPVPRAWRLTAAELGLATRRAGVGRAPFPLAVPRVDARAAVAVERGLRVRGLLDAEGRPEPGLRRALGTLLAPRRSVDALGWFPGGPADLVRVVAAAGPGRAGAPGVLALQLPGPDSRTGGEVLLREVDPDRLGPELAASLPAAPPGARRATTVAVTAPGSDADGPADVHRSAGDTRRAELADLLGGARAGGGQLAVTVHPDGAPPHRELVLRWHDRAGDGRYLVTVGAAEVGAAPAGCQEVGAALTAALRRAVARVSDAVVGAPLQR
ncbi:hypothetical protein GCM10027047_15410 [Rhodococcus aerolatus]